jgi:hypothetical protein
MSEDKAKKVQQSRKPIPSSNAQMKRMGATDRKGPRQNAVIK